MAAGGKGARRSPWRWSLNERTKAFQLVDGVLERGMVGSLGRFAEIIAREKRAAYGRDTPCVRRLPLVPSVRDDRVDGP